MKISGHYNAKLGDFRLAVEFSLPGNGITAIYGPSGSGKSSFLRAIAGLDHHAEGELWVDGQCWQKPGKFLPPHQRPVAYVFQHANLFEHLNVQANLEYGWSRISAGRRRISLEQVSAVLDLAPLAQRRTDTLSGGERQRVAIGRALAVNPQLLLMDEPLTSLDQQRRDEILPCLLKLQQEFSMPIIYVSHDRTEISRIADHLVLLQAGKIVASDRCENLLTRLDLSLAHEASASSIFDAVAVSVDPQFQLTTFNCGGTEFIVPGMAHQPGEHARLLIASRDVSLALSKAKDSSVLNIIPARVDAISTPAAGSVTVRLLAGDHVLLSRITSKSAEQLNLQQNMEVYAQVKSIALSGTTPPATTLPGNTAA
ncbi:MAG TPA: molybdenum ABC transporter ATP-binding protein [Xanthomonadales bacterium]|nr:molybdenum ABC transporter ATP-binding protein [Xanthomonadales bacterium]